MSTRLAAALVVLALGAGALAAGVFKVGDTADDATLAMVDGTERKLSAVDGHATLLYFYGMWPRRAADDAKSIETLRKARAKQKLDVIGIARDAKAADAKKFAEDAKLGFPQAVDAKSELYAKFATKGIPYVVVLDPSRKVKYSAAGIDADAIETALTELLGAKDAPDAPPPKK